MSKFLALLCFISIPAVADEWTTGDTYREATYQTISAVDWLQTLQISESCHRPIKTVVIDGKLYLDGDDYQKHAHLTEMNPLLGTCPSSDKVSAYFLISGVAHYYIAKALPEKYRAAFQYVSIGFEGGVVAHNYSIGISVRF